MNSYSSLGGCVILVIGGMGQSGSCAVRRLLLLSSEDTVVRVMSRSADQTAVKKRFGAEVQVVKGDVADVHSVREAMVDVTHVFYLVGPVPSLSFLLRGTTVEAAYVTGLKNVLNEGRGSSSFLRQVILLSAKNCDRPWALMSMLVNTVAGMSQLMHLRQERLLREEAQSRTDFNYVILRPPLLGRADVPPERVTLQSVESPGVRGRSSRSVSRAAVVELMVHALVSELPIPRSSITLTLSSAGVGPASADFDWTGSLAALPRDKAELPGPERDISHTRARRVFLLSVGIVLAVVGFLPITYFAYQFIAK